MNFGFVILDFGLRKRILAIGVATLILAAANLASAQQTKIPRIGFLSGRGAPTPANPDPSADAFRQGLRDLGHVDGKNILVDFRYAEGELDRIPAIVAEFVQRKVDVLVSPSSPAILEAKRTTKTIPIVMTITVDPVVAGMVESLARPGGNVTGLTRLTRDLSGKRLELLKETIPGISRVGVLWSATTATPGQATAFTVYEAAARELKLRLQSLEVRAPNPNLEGAFRDAAKGRVGAVITARTVALIPYPKKIADIALKHRVASMFEDNESVEVGGLMSYSASDTDSFRRAAVYVDKILKGAKPADLPVEQPTKFELVINLKTAKQIGLTIPPNVLARADKVIK
jgi:putative ABC transport system substrate-binding protein